ncbi:hypothetical protein CYLTODRAFT_202028 [Cylindrobasidium torrendii FP15055 ss-10]|uniref:Rab-GAP TBC domain-containing protein n=1 Tax=Cylindrobasidium torrendii FP15055 ss-10 TaxID=1314674 RepID=A0A0D7BIM4_9AGAR|nr:hypothetical protein CYLTODRAFT_202028 [Cylindrobasidium torrendii FP15055 ss-10]
MAAPPTAMPTLPPPAKDARDREGKFLMALSEGKKKKKLKKLVLDGGVPMSLRWLVWMEFVSSTALPNHPDGPGGGGPIGGGLGGGGPGGRNTEALKALLDAVEGEGPGRLKAAYRRMCPDVGWGEELDQVLPFLLGLAPEQDAFWIFCCVMDTHLRAYYSENAQNLEIDGELLARTLSKTDAALGHHLLTTLGIPAGTLARGIGLRGAFVGRLDDEEAVRRIWDLWLCEGGLPTLIRTAVTLLVHGSRRQALLATRDAEAALELMQSRLNGVKVEELLMKNSKMFVCYRLCFVLLPRIYSRS